MRRELTHRTAANRAAAPLADREQFWQLVQDELDERRDPFDDERLATWMARHADDAHAVARMCESTQRLARACAPARRARAPIAIAAAAGLLALLGAAFAWRASRERSRDGAVPTTVAIDTSTQHAATRARTSTTASSSVNALSSASTGTAPEIALRDATPRAPVARAVEPRVSSARSSADRARTTLVAAAPARGPGRVLSFEARTVVARDRHVEERVLDLDGERVTTVGPDLVATHEHALARTSSVESDKRSF